jgi:hypothetical protein
MAIIFINLYFLRGLTLSIREHGKQEGVPTVKYEERHYVGLRFTIGLWMFGAKLLYTVLL